MFENPLINRLPLLCPEHQKMTLSHICIDAKCEGWPLFCEECRSSYRHKERHYGHQLSVLELPKGIDQLCGKLEREKKAASTIYHEMLSLKGVEGLLKWQQQKQQHFNSIENHMNTIKFQVEEEINNILLKFQEELINEKNKLYQELEQYYQNYKEKFDRFSRLTEPIVAMQNKFKFYASPSVLFYKVSCEMGQAKLGIWLTELKKTISQTEKATAIPTEYSEQIKKYGELANQIMDDLPRIRNMDYEKEMPMVMANAAQEVLRSLVKIKEIREIASIMRSNSMDRPAQSLSRKYSVGGNR